MAGKICNAITAVMIALLLVMVGLLVLPKAFGGASLAVITPSMEPNVPVGSLVVVNQRVTVDDLTPGDVIVFNLGGETTATHRLMEINRERQRLITKGDNNPTLDGEVAYDRLVGKVVVGIPQLGKIASIIQTRQGIPLIGGFVIVMILLIFIPEILKKENE